jgi:hypothetical protein
LFRPWRIAFWVGYAAAELAPLYERLKQHLLASSRLAVDETPGPVLDPVSSACKCTAALPGAYV